LGAVAAWSLLQLADRPVAATPFVGRAGDRARLRAAFARTTSGHATFVLISGEPGIGKTRLAEEFIGGLAGAATVLRARCRPGTEVGASTPLRQLLTNREASSLPPTIAHAVGLTRDERLMTLDVRDRRNEIEAAWREYLVRLARERPHVVWIDDLQWAEPETIRVLDRATFQNDAAIMVLATARADFPAITAIRPSEDRMFLELTPLGPADAAALAEAVGARHAERISRAAGNPLFIVELSRSRAEVADEVPLTLQAAIAARLDELAPGERHLLQCAAVVGETFGIRDAALLSEQLPDEVAGTLGRLAHLGHVEPIDGAFRFHHVLVHDAAYGRLPTSARMRLHARYAREGLDPGDVEALAHHWWEALRPPDAEWVWEDEPAERETMRSDALRVHLAAGQRLGERLAVDRMVLTFERALQLSKDVIETAQTEEAFGLAYHRNAKGDEATVHRLRAIDLYKSSGRTAPARLYADMLDIPVYNWAITVVSRVPTTRSGSSTTGSRPHARRTNHEP
jgi:predicted ATPase